MNQGAQSSLMTVLSILLFSIILGILVAFLPGFKDLILISFENSVNNAPLP